MVFEILRGSVVSHRVGSSLLGDAAASSHRVHEVEDTTTLCGKCIHVSPHLCRACLYMLHTYACVYVADVPQPLQPCVLYIMVMCIVHGHVYCTWSCVLYMVMCIVHHGHVYCTWSCVLYMVKHIVSSSLRHFSPNQAGVVTTKEIIPSPKQS